MTVLYGAQVLLAMRIALGGARRSTYVMLALLFSAGYFISQLNSYQHHYLLAIALGLLAAFPWPDLASATGKAGEQGKAGKQSKAAHNERDWPVRMLLVALSVMYVFAAVAKLDGAWLDGSTLQRQITSGWTRDIAEGLGWAATAKLTILVELSLALFIHIRRLWPLAILLGVGMHLTFEFSGLRIGLFSYFMATLYLLLLPDGWVDVASKRVAPVTGWVSARLATLDANPRVALPVFVVALAVAAALVQTIFIDSVNALTWCVIAAALLDLGLTRLPASAGLKTLVAALALLYFVHGTDALRTYYHFWGHNDRRNKDLASAIIHYENVVRIDPAYLSGRQRLGDSYKSMGRTVDALEQYQAGLTHDPGHFKLNRGAALMYHQLGRGPEALEAARRCLAASSRDRACQQIVARYSSKQGTDAQK